MNKFLFFSIACLFFAASNVNSQVVYQEDFEALTVGSGISEQLAEKWATISKDGGKDPKVTDTKFKSGSKSLHIAKHTNAILKYGKLTEGNISTEFQVSVSNNKYAHISILQKVSEQDNSKSVSGGEIIFFNGNIFIIGSGEVIRLEDITYDSNTWLTIKVIVDLTNDNVNYFFNNKNVFQYKWSNGSEKDGTGVNELVGILFDGMDLTLQNKTFSADFYIDDIKMETLAQQSPVKNLTFKIENKNDIKLSWEAPENGTPENFEITKEGKTIASIPASQLSYEITRHEPGTFTYGVVANHGPNGKNTNTIEVKIEGGVDRQFIIYEVFTSIHCKYCPSMAKLIDSFADEKNLKTGIIEYHFDMGAKDPYSSQDYIKRLQYYQILGFPSLVINGSSFNSNSSNPKQELIDKHNSLKTQPSALSIKTDAKYLENGKYSFEINIKEELKINDEEIRLFAVLTETDIPQKWKGLNHVNFVARKMYPSKEGKIISFNGQESIKETLEVTIPSSYKSENCDLVIFIQNIKTGYILQADKVKIVDINTSIAEKTNELELRIYPNPAVEVLNIESSSIIDKVEILSIDGKIINSFNVNDTKAEFITQNLVKGFYIARIYQDNKINNKHFVVK